jgi:hypothetical protein
MTSEEGFTVRDRRIERGDAERGGPFQPPFSPRPDEPDHGLEHAAAGPPESSDLPPEPDLPALFFLLANSALFHLGETPGTPAGERPVDLAQARFTIDLLRLLKEKTEGNRTPDESRLLEGILYDLQMRFVQALGVR